jgi:hypothetical protein
LRLDAKNDAIVQSSWKSVVDTKRRQVQPHTAEAAPVLLHGSQTVALLARRPTSTWKAQRDHLLHMTFNTPQQPRLGSKMSSMSFKYVSAQTRRLWYIFRSPSSLMKLCRLLRMAAALPNGAVQSSYLPQLRLRR